MNIIYKEVQSNYQELARRVGDTVLFNSIEELGDWYEYYYEPFCGSVYHELEEGGEEQEPKEFYQYYHITVGGAEYLKDYTDETVIYYEPLDVYIWCISHFGTGWDYVPVMIKEIDFIK